MKYAAAIIAALLSTCMITNGVSDPVRSRTHPAPSPKRNVSG
jgi:hypothetical protein